MTAADKYSHITVVTGFGRCGSSLVMQMLAAGGMPCCGEYPAFEGEQGAAILRDALTVDMLPPGHAVKLLDPHRGSIPRGPDYRVIWMSRDHAEQGKSQAKFLSTLTGMRLGREDARAFARSYVTDTAKLLATLSRAGADAVLRLTFESVLAQPHRAAEQIAAHVGIEASRAEAMASVVLPRHPACRPDLAIEMSLIAARP